MPRLTARWPSAVQIWRQKLATLVLPLVPVTATTVSGWAPNQSAAARAKAWRGVLGEHQPPRGPSAASAIRAPSASVRTAAAPRATAMAA